MVYGWVDNIYIFNVDILLVKKYVYKSNKYNLLIYSEIQFSIFTFLRSNLLQNLFQMYYIMENKFKSQNLTKDDWVDVKPTKYMLYIYI